VRLPSALDRVYSRHGEKLRFLVVGVWNTIFGLGLLWLLERFIPYDPGSMLHKQGILLVNWVICVTHNFFSFKFLVFRTRGNWLKEYLRMYVTYIGTFVVQSVMVQAISAYFGLSLFLANLPTIVVVTVMSYLGHKYFTFRTKEEAIREDLDAEVEPEG
jgi:putative flippase GtrA